MMSGIQFICSACGEHSLPLARFGYKWQCSDKNRVGSILSSNPSMSRTLVLFLIWPQLNVTCSLKVSLGKMSIGSKCEWNVSITVNGTFSRCSMIQPIVTSSGKPIRSPIDMNLPKPAIGSIFNASARLIQKPAPPVANTNEIFLCGCFSSFCKTKEREREEKKMIDFEIKSMQKIDTFFSSYRFKWVILVL